LEDLAVSLRRPAKFSRRDTGGAMERAYEIGEVAEPDIERDIGDRTGALGQQTGRMAQSGADEILVRGYPEHPREEPQKVKGAESNLSRCAFQIKGLVRVLVNPKCRLHGAPPIPRAGLRGTAFSPRDDLDEAGGEHDSDFVETDGARALGGGLCELSHDHQLRQRRYTADAPDIGLCHRDFGIDRLDEGWSQHKGQTFISAAVLVSAHVLVARIADEDRAGDQLERFSPGVVAKAALSHVGDGKVVMRLDERLVGRSGAASVIEDRDRSASQQQGGHQKISKLTGGYRRRSRNACQTLPAGCG